MGPRPRLPPGAPSGRRLPRRVGHVGGRSGSRGAAALGAVELPVLTLSGRAPPTLDLRSTSVRPRGVFVEGPAACAPAGASISWGAEAGRTCPPVDAHTFPVSESIPK